MNRQQVLNWENKRLSSSKITPFVPFPSSTETTCAEENELYHEQQDKNKLGKVDIASASRSARVGKHNEDSRLTLKKTIQSYSSSLSVLYYY